jgi:hypothetical protein
MHKYVADPVAAFDKSMKHDTKDFSIILDIKDWDRGMQASAKVQYVEPPFDPTYVPSTDLIRHYLTDKMGMPTKYSLMLSGTLCSRPN